MKDTTHLALYLEAPLQSWGHQSRYDYRTSLSYPTRSGILGLICAAMGIDRNDTASLQRLNPIKMITYIFRKPSHLIDYHTTGGGYDNSIKSAFIVPTANGKKQKTSVTYREYTENGRFGVILSGNLSLMKEIAEALKNPRWGIWLGRKSCIPTSPIFQGIYNTHEESLQNLIKISGVERPKREILEVDQFDEGTDTIMDIPLDFAKREFAPRRVKVV